MSLILKVCNESTDNSIKMLWESESKQLFESVCVPFYQKGFYAICLSSQAGCNLGCVICETAKYNYDPKSINISAENLYHQALKTKKIGDEKYKGMPFDEFSFM